MTSQVPFFTWFELATPDMDASIAFYSAVVGWTAERQKMSDKPYAMFSASGTPVAGVSLVNGASPSWTGSIMVDDLDATLKRARDAGAKVIYGPEEVPDMVRYAVLADPQGVIFSIHQELEKLPEKHSSDPMRPGTFGWSELHAEAMEPAYIFYSNLFGWKKTEDLQMSEMGNYRLFTAGEEHPVGGMMTKTVNCPGAYWQFYINVDDLDSAIERITKHGGTIKFGPTDVPGGARIIIATDPHDIYFALVQPPAVPMKK